MDGRQQTADRRRTGFQPVGGQAVNEWGSTDRGPQTAGGRQTLVGRAFQPVRDCQQMGERINESDRSMDNRKHWGAAGRHRKASHSQRGFTDCDPSSERPGSRGAVSDPPVFPAATSRERDTLRGKSGYVFSPLR
jgi:hypothetical protein